MSNPVFAADEEAQKNLRAAIEKIIATHVASGVVNDAAFAVMKAGSLRRQGQSRNAITRRLAQKGIASPLISDAMEAEKEDGDPAEAEMKAARLYAKKRGFGKKKMTPDRKRKAIASFARAGFSYAIASHVLSIQEDIWDETGTVFDSASMDV